MNGMTKGAILGVTLVILGFLFDLIAIGVPYWYTVKVPVPYTERPQLMTQNLDGLLEAEWGLWQYCETKVDPRLTTVPPEPGSYEHPTNTKKECKNLVTGDTQGYIRGTQAMMLIGLLFMIAGAASGVLFCVARGNDELLVFLSVMGIPGALFTFAGLVIFGLCAPYHIFRDIDYVEYNNAILELIRHRHYAITKIEWGFALGAVAGILCILGAVFVTGQWERREVQKTYVETGYPMSAKSLYKRDSPEKAAEGTSSV